MKIPQKDLPKVVLRSLTMTELVTDSRKRSKVRARREQINASTKKGSSACSRTEGDKCSKSSVESLIEMYTCFMSKEECCDGGVKKKSIPGQRSR